MGGAPELLLDLAQLPAGIEKQLDGFIRFRDSARLLELTAERLDCPDFALRLAARQGADMLGGIAVIARNSATPREAVTWVKRFMPLHSPAVRIALGRGVTPGSERLSFELQDPALVDMYQVCEQTLGNARQILSVLAGPEATPSLVLLPHRPRGDKRHYREYFGCPVEFDQSCCALECPASLLDQPVPTADPATRQLASRYLEQLVVAPDTLLAEQVTQLIRQLLPTGKYQIGVVAAEMSLHPRTLQRRLAGEQCRFETLLERVRRELAREYLAEPGLSLAQITGLLGYAEQSTFNRAFRRWYGETPRMCRTRLLSR
nr:AraC family transcriptional regulator [Microbulbifer sediminum]